MPFKDQKDDVYYIIVPNEQKPIKVIFENDCEITNNGFDFEYTKKCQVPKEIADLLIESYKAMNLSKWQLFKLRFINSWYNIKDNIKRKLRKLK